MQKIDDIDIFGFQEGGSATDKRESRFPELTPAQTANILGAFADPLGLIDISGEFPEFPAPGVSMSEMVIQGPRSPSLVENLREGNFGAAALQSMGAIPVIGGAARTARGMIKAADRLAKAEKAGFDTGTVYYHATDKLESGDEFTQLMPSERGKLGPGIYMSPDPKYTERYIRTVYQTGNPDSPLFDDNARILPVFVRGKIGDIKDYDVFFNKAQKELDTSELSFPDARDLLKNKAKEDMAQAGFTGFKVGDELVIFDPKNVRSVNANFEDLDSPELLKASGGAIDINDIDIFEPVQNFVIGGGVRKKLLSGKADDAEKGIGSIPVDDETVRGSDLQFLMNIGPEGIEKAQRLGGFPMPSLAITRQDLPFQSFGEITLIGSPTKFDPKRLKANVVFNADAYTVRAPQPFRIAKKNADRKFRDKYQLIAEEFDEGRVDNIVYELGNMEMKKTATASSFSDVQRFFQSDPVADVAFLRDQGDTRSIPRRLSGLIEQSELRKMVQEYGDARKKWGQAQLDELFDGSEVFDASVNRDFYTGEGRVFKPFTGEEVLKFMKKRRGAAQEGGAFSVSPGKLRASLTERLNSLKQIRDQSARLVDDKKFTKFKDDSYQRVTDLAESLKPFYRFDSSGFRFYDEVIELLIESEKRGLPRVMQEFGFDDVPQSVVDEIQAIKSYFRTAPTEYFEAKPQRLVDLEEFKGAIVPEGTSDDLVQVLKDAGIQVETYADDAQRLAARKKFEGTAFSVAGGITLVGLMAPEESYATDPSNYAKIKKAVEELEGSFPDPQVQESAGILGALRGAGEVAYEGLSDLLIEPFVGMSGAELAFELGATPEEAEAAKERARRLVDFETTSPTGLRYKEAVKSGLGNLGEYLMSEGEPRMLRTGVMSDPIRSPAQVLFQEVLDPAAEAVTEGALGILSLDPRDTEEMQKVRQEAARPVIEAIQPI